MDHCALVRQSAGLERTVRFELTTPDLEGRCSSPELRPHSTIPPEMKRIPGGNSHPPGTLVFHGNLTRNLRFSISALCIELETPLDYRSCKQRVHIDDSGLLCH